MSEKKQALSKEEVRLYFDAQATIDKINDPFISTMYWQKRRDIIKLLPPQAGRILDVGCGTGRFEEALLHYRNNSDISAIGIDMSSKSIEVAKSKQALENCEFLCGDAESLPFKDDSFDCCVLIEVIEHVSDKESTLRELKRVLKPHGKLVITTPNKRDIILRMYNLLWNLEKKVTGQEMIHKDEYLSIEGLAALVEGVGLKLNKKTAKYLNPSGISFDDKTYGIIPPLPPSLNLRLLKLLLKIEKRYQISDFIREYFAWTIFICASKEG